MTLCVRSVDDVHCVALGISVGVSLSENDRYIKVVQNVKALYNSFYRCFFLWRRSLVKSGTYESRWGSDIAGNAEETTACTK